MIDRYSIISSIDQIRDRFSAEWLGTFTPYFNASPTSILPVITLSAPQGISNFYWGTSPEWSANKPVSEKIINVLAEAINEKTSLKKMLMKNRCIIPADGFYAWKKTGKKTFVPYRFVCTDQPLFAFAGLWDEFEDTDGNTFHTFSVITVVSNALVSTVQPRMPLILDKKAEAVWLNKEATESELLELMKSYPAEQMSFYPVSPRISDPKINVPSLITPTHATDQFGNLTLFD